MPSGECCKRVLLKFIEIGLNVICAALILKYNCTPVITSFSIKTLVETDMTRSYLTTATVGAFMLISTLIVISYAFEGFGKAPILEGIMMAVGAALSVTTAGLVLDVYINMDKSDSEVDKAGTAVGSLQALNGIIYLIDTIVVFRGKAS